MRNLSLFLIALFAATTLARFVPVPAYNLSLLEGGWLIQSVYDTVGNDWSLTYCLEIDFEIINSSAVNMSTFFYDGFSNQLRQEYYTLYPDSENPAILYQDTDHIQAPLVILSSSAIPHWNNTNVSTTIFAFNYTKDSQDPQYVIMGGSQGYDAPYDISPFLKSQNVPINYTHNFWFINSNCKLNYEWSALKSYDARNLLKIWNLIGVYEPAGSGLAPWYTGGAIYEWDQAYCAQVSFVPGEGNDDLMTLSLKSLYEGDFQRTWQVLPAPDLNAALLGFEIDQSTLLYVQYADKLGNLILTAGTTTSFFLSTSATSLTPAYKEVFEAALSVMGWKYDASLIYSIDSSTC